MLNNSAFGTKFRFEFDDPDYQVINDSIIGCNLPGITLGVATRKTDGKNAFFPGTSIDISDLSITIKSDDSYVIWAKFVKWLIDNYNGKNLMTTGSLYLLDPKDNPIFSLSLFSIFPNSVSEITYTRTDGQPEILTYTANLKINGIVYNFGF